MSMSDINRNNLRQSKMSVVDREKMELEALEYWLTNKPEVYGDELDAVRARYEELKEYFG